MSPSIAQIREQLRNRNRKIEAEKVEGEDANGFTFGFDPSLRRKYEQIMRLVGYVEDNAYAESDVSKGYFCGSCEYLRAETNSPTGYHCSKYLFPDRPFGCCGGYDKKEER